MKWKRSSRRARWRAKHYDCWKEAWERWQGRERFEFAKKNKKMVETFSARWRVAALEGVILGSWALKRNHQNRTMLMGRQETALHLCTVSCNPALKFKRKFHWKLRGPQRISLLRDKMASAGLNISCVLFHQLSRSSVWEPFSQNSASAWIYSHIFWVHAENNYSVATAPFVFQVFKFFLAKWSKYFLHLIVMFSGSRWQASAY